MSVHFIETTENTYRKIDSGEQKSLIVPMNRTIEKKYSTHPPEDICLTVAGANHPRLTFTYSGHTTENRNGKDCVVLPIKELQRDLF